jgi:hypothetical protein
LSEEAGIVSAGEVVPEPALEVDLKPVRLRS